MEKKLIHEELGEANYYLSQLKYIIPHLKAFENAFIETGFSFAGYWTQIKKGFPKSLLDDLIENGMNGLPDGSAKYLRPAVQEAAAKQYNDLKALYDKIIYNVSGHWTRRHGALKYVSYAKGHWFISNADIETIKDLYFRTYIDNEDEAEAYKLCQETADAFNKFDKFVKAKGINHFGGFTNLKPFLKEAEGKMQANGDAIVKALRSVEINKRLAKEIREKDRDQTSGRLNTRTTHVNSPLRSDLGK